MREIEPAFQLTVRGIPATITEHEVKGQRVFHIDFKGLKKPLVITVGFDRQDKKFWTSIPEGRQSEAEEVGKLIARYIRSKK
jgi:hypothetical protein